MSDTTLRHIEHFATTIGPRGSTTPEEEQAHDYCEQVYRDLGYEPKRDAFQAPVSGWHPYALALAVMLVATALFVLFGRGPNAQVGALAAAAFGLIATVCFFLQALSQPNPLQWFLPTAPSQNVWAVAAPRGEVRRRVVVVGHVDTHRTALAMQSPALWQTFQILTTLGGVVCVVLVALFVWGMFTPDPLPRTIALVAALVPLAGLVFTLQPDFTRYVPGANDNATGAAAVLALAERLRQQPLDHTQVFLLNSGCEEVGPPGMMDWIGRHAAADAPQADYLILDSIGGRGAELNYLVDETMVLPVKADPGLVALAKRVAREHPELAAKPHHMRGMFTELSYITHNGQRGIAIVNFDPRTGMIPGWHTQRDTPDGVDPDLLDRSEQFVWALLQAIDAGEPAAR